MKKILILLVLFVTSLLAQAQTRQLKVYLHEGVVDTLRMTSGSTIAHSRINLQGERQDDYVTMIVTIGDSIRKYAIADLDSLVLPNGQRIVFRGSQVVQPIMARAMGDVTPDDVGDLTGQVIKQGMRKTSFSGTFPGSDIVTFYWTENDRIRLDVGDEARAEDLSADKTEATFIFDGAELEGRAYVVYYPNKTVTIASEQTQTGANNSDHIGDAGDCGTALAELQSDGTYGFTLEHKASYLCFLPHIDNLPSAKISKIVLTSSGTIAGNYQMARSGLYDPQNGSSTITLNLNPQRAKDFYLGHNVNTVQDTCAAYMVIAPQTGSVNFTATYYLTDTLSRITTTYQQSFSFQPVANTVYPINCKIPDDLFSVVDMGLSTKWSHVNLTAKEPSQGGTTYAFTDKDPALSSTPVTQWATPTKLQMQELIDGCTWEPSVYNGVNGWLVTAKNPGYDGECHRLFLPNASYWTSGYTSPDSTSLYSVTLASSQPSLSESAVSSSLAIRPVEVLMVDMGLPGKSLWATHNVGATAPSMRGEYYAWGETETKNVYSLATYDPLHNGTGAYDNLDVNISGTKYDVARVKWGGAWHMPTTADFNELNNNSYCQWTWTTLNGQNGYIVKSLSTGNSIFLPAAGYRENVARNSNASYGFYYSSEPYGSATNTYAYALGFKSNGRGVSYYYDMYHQRYKGFTIRPIVTYTGSSLMVTSDSVQWRINDTEAILHGTFASTAPLTESVKVGFLVGDSLNLTMANADSVFTFTRSANGTFSATMPVYKNVGHWWRAYVQDADTIILGDVLEYGVRMVDLGLPSGVLWSNMNVGASSVEGRGDYYQWGEVVTKTTYNYANYDPLGNGVSQYDNIGTNISGNEAYDAARHNLGGYWRMPTKTELDELVNNCDWRWITINGQTGMRFTSRINGNSIFLPAAGYYENATLKSASDYGSYLSSVPYNNNATNTYAYTLGLNSSGRSVTYYYGYYFNRYKGFSIRPVAIPGTLLSTGARIDIETDTLDYVPGTDQAQLYGTLTKYNHWSDNMSVGFIIGDKANFTAEEAVDTITTTVRNPGQYSLEVPYTGGDRWFRAVLFDGDDSYVGRAIHYATIVTTDSASYRQGSSAETVTLYGKLTTDPLTLSQPVKVGFYIGKDKYVDRATAIDSVKTTVDANGKFSLTIAAPDTIVYYRAFVEFNDTCRGYGISRHFGFAFVDLGLPSGTWWANTDLGAASEITAGPTYAWGEIAPKTQSSQDNYAHYDATNGYADIGHDIAYSQYDAATHELGALTSMPSLAQYDELFKYTTQVRDTVDGVSLTKYVGPNGNSIILYSAAWTSTENALQFAYMGTPGSTMFTSKTSGMSIRPVRRVNAFDANGVQLGVTADSAQWSAESTVATLYGSVHANSAFSPVMVGFVVGDSATVTKATADDVLSKQVGEAGKFSLEYSYQSRPAYYRAFVELADTTYYGNARRVGIGYVDLGLPSHTLWADMNLGAEEPSGLGYYITWGDTIATRRQFGNPQNCDTYDGSIYKEIGSNIANSQYDAARILGKGLWSLPTSTQWQELYSCTWKQDTVNHIVGYRVTGPNEKSIFIPAICLYSTPTGYYSPYYWTANTTRVATGDPTSQYANLAGRNFSTNPRFYGMPVRAAATYTNITRDSTYLYLAADSCDWTPNSTEVHLYGTLRSQVPLTGTTYGFVIGKNNNPEVGAEGVTQLTTTNEGGQLTATSTFVGDRYYYRPYITVGDTTYYGKEKRYGYAMIDLGLPSHTLWADVNLGSTTDDGYGDFYQFGETEPQLVPPFDDSTLTTLYQSITDSLGVIAHSQYDAASVNMGGVWSIPTRAEILELVRYCTTKADTLNGTWGVRLTGPNGNSIFIPRTYYASGNSLPTYNSGAPAIILSANVYLGNLNGSNYVWQRSYYNTVYAVQWNFNNGWYTDNTYGTYLGYPLRAVAHVSDTLATTNKPVSAVLQKWMPKKGADGADLLEARIYGVPVGKTISQMGIILGRDSLLTRDNGTVYTSQSKDIVVEAPAGVDNINYYVTLVGSSYRTTVPHISSQMWSRPYFVVDGETYYGLPHTVGPHLVDLGLPSGTMWADINIGSIEPGGEGEYYQWGELVPDEEEPWRAYSNGTYKYNNVFIGNDIARTEYDAASYKWSAMYAMPTDLQWRELMSNTTLRPDTVNGSYGMRFISRANGNSIFMPYSGYRYDMSRSNYGYSGAYGYYWSSNQSGYDYNSSSYYAYSYVGYFYGSNTLNGYHYDGNTYNRYYGMPIRPVGKVSAYLADGTPIYLEPISAELSPLGYQLTGTLSLPSGLTASAVGFYVGDAEDVNAETGTLIAATLANDTITSTGHAVLDGNRRWFRPYVVINGETVLGSAKEYGVELVDMGLPSGTKWASMNLGASDETDAGDYYQWGDLEPDDIRNSYAYSGGSYDPLGDGTGYPDDLGGDISGTQYDAVRAAWGNIWSMPTQDQFNELMNNSTVQQVFGSNGNTAGYRIISKINGNRIYLPSAGYYSNSSSSPYLSTGSAYYWTSLTSSLPNATYFYMSSPTYWSSTYTQQRWNGTPLRPVARQNAALADGTLIYVGGTGANLHDGDYNFTGTVLNIPASVTVSSAGFVVGDDELVTVETGTTVDATLDGETFASTQTMPDTGTKRWYRPFIVVDGETIYGTASQFGVVLVDLGLPSGTLWADANLGANLPSEKGDFYLWGETTAPKMQPGTTAFLPPNYSLYDSSKGGFLDVGMDISYTEYDAAHAKMGGIIGMPNVTQMKELVTNCTFVPAKVDGAPGVWAVSRINNNRIFLPANGYWYFNNGAPSYNWDSYSPDLYYWTASIQENTGGTNVYAHVFYSEYPNGNASTTTAYATNTYYRYNGYGIRPVAQFNTTALDGRKFFFKSDSVAMHTAVPEAKLYATARGITSSMTDVTRGFVIGTTATVEAGDAISTHAATALPRGQFGATLDADYIDGLAVGTTYYVRPYLTVGTETFYGDAMTVTNSLTAYTDSTDWKQGATTVTFYGHADGATASSSPTYGFLLGDNADITAASEGVRNLSTTLNDGVLTAQVNDLAQGVYYYRAYAKVGDGYAYGIARRFGNGLVDLGLPSGTLWTTANLGSQNDFTVGDRYAWGETEAKTTFTLPTYDPAGDGTGSYDDIGTDISHTAYDVARQQLGASYFIPTKALWDELRNNCTVVTDTVEGVVCYKLTSKVEGYTDRFIYLPYGTGLWSSSTNGVASSQTAWWFSYGNVTLGTRYTSGGIRPVYQQNITTANGDDMFLHADGVDYDTSALTATLNGTVRGITTEMTDVKVGFVVGTSEDVEISTAMEDGVLENETTTADGSFSNVLPAEFVDKFEVGVTYYARPYITIGGTETIYGNALAIRNTLTVTTDSTSWQYGATTTRLCGTVQGTTASSSPTYGFVVGKSATITVTDDGVTVVDATLDGEVFKGTLAATPDGVNYYRAFAKVNERYVYADALRFGLELVDLGLRSGTLWSNIDLGAKSDIEYGPYYAWGETAPKDTYDFAHYDPKGDGGNVYDNIGNDIQFTKYDAATQNMGGLFAIPTQAQWYELIAGCIVTPETVDGRSGYRYTSRADASKSIFMFGPPRWSSEKQETSNYLSYAFSPGSTSPNTIGVYSGMSIRPVYCGNVKLADETILNVSADNCDWKFDAANVNVYGTVRGSVEGRSLTYGFVVGDNADITVNTEGVRNVTATRSGTKLSARIDNTFGKSYYRAYVKEGDNYFYSTARNYGMELVDLGLPSGTLWAALNLGATAESEQGSQYAWGETSTKSSFSSSNYDPLGNGTGVYDNIGINISGTQYDAATKAYGGVFAMPTREQIQELLDNSSMTNTTVNGVSGYLYTGTRKGYQNKSIFIPSGNIWTSEVYTNATNSYAYYYGSGNTSSSNYTSRTSGYYIRPVYNGNTKLNDGRRVTLLTTGQKRNNDESRTLKGSLAGLATGMSVTKVGFVVSGVETVGVSTAADDTFEGTLGADGTFSATMPAASIGRYPADEKVWMRAFAVINGVTYYANAKSWVPSATDIVVESVKMKTTGTDELDYSDYSVVTIEHLYDDGGATGNYSHNANYALKLTAAEGCTWTITGTVTTESCCDYVSIYDGSTSAPSSPYNSGYREKIGGNNVDVNFKSTGNVIYVCFHSDGSVDGSGFDLQLKAE